MDKQTYVSKVFALQDENGCWNVLKEGDRYFPVYNYYVPNYKSTLWTLILLADLEIDPSDARVIKPLEILCQQFYNEKVGIFTIGKSHFPIPCLNGNMLYLLSYFNSGEDQHIDGIVDFFHAYQRFDDGDFVTPRTYPYFGNKSCYGAHTCYWGVVKLFKGLSFIPLEKRSEKAKQLIQRCVDFILLHEVCYASHDASAFIHPVIGQLTFPNMYQSDYLEVLWLLQRESVVSSQMERAQALLAGKMNADNTYKLERKIKDLAVPFGRTSFGNEMLTERAQKVVDQSSSK